MEKKQKLYRVTLRGLTYSVTGIVEGISYVIAQNSDEAYKKVKDRLDKKEYGFSKDRELNKVELLASDDEYNDIGTLLYM